MNEKVKNIFFISFGTVLNVILGFITVPIITHLVSPDAYGRFSIILTYINIIVAICLMGFDQAYVRYYYHINTIEYKRELTKKVLVLPLATSLFSCIGIICFGPYLVDESLLTCILVGVCVVITIFETFTKLCIRLEQNGIAYSSVLIIHRLSYAVIVLTLVYFSTIDSAIVLLIGTGGALLINIFISIIIKNVIWLNFQKTQNHIKLEELFRYSYPFLFSALANWVFNATGNITLKHFSTYEEVGLYSAAGSIVSIITVLQTTFTTIWVPMAVENFEKNPENKFFYKESNDIITVLMILSGLTIVLFKDVFTFILGPSYSEASQIFPFLILHPVMFAISETTVYGINFFKKTRWHVVITVVSSVINIVGNLCLVPLLGAKGSAISVGLSYIIFFILRTIISNKFYKISFAYFKIGISIFITVLYLAYQTIFKTNVMSLLLYFFALVIVFCMYFNTISKFSKLFFVYLKMKLRKE